MKSLAQIQAYLNLVQMDDQLTELVCADDSARYEQCLIRPAGQVDLQAIVDEKEHNSSIAKYTQ